MLHVDHKVRPSTPRPDFMHTGYAFIKEPLNLWQAGQKWLTGIYEQERDRTRQGALVLGATPWLAKLLCRNYRRVVLVDVNEAMLRLSGQELSEDPAASDAKIEFVQADWTAMPLFPEPFSMVIGDNSFTFLPFAEVWNYLCEELDARMCCGAKLLIRVLSVPAGHRSISADEIVERFIAYDSINYTEVRANLLFSQWDEGTYAISTERALAEFEANQASFQRLFARFPILPDNDLITVTKYRGSGMIYYAPPLPEVLKLIERTFRVTSVHFGPYAMSQYFPLLVASKE
jgi:SAM-dependent methyltransferase